MVFAFKNNNIHILNILIVYNLLNFHELLAILM